MIRDLPIPPRNYNTRWSRLLAAVPVGGSEMVPAGIGGSLINARIALLNAARRGGWVITTRKVAGGVRFWVIARPE